MSHPRTDQQALHAGRPARRRELREQGRTTLRRLLDSGAGVIAERGFHATRIDDVVRRAGIAHGTFYRYFANKDDLLAALARCVEDEAAALAETAPRCPRTEPDELDRWVENLTRFFLCHEPILRSLRNVEHGPAPGAVTDPLRDRLIELLEVGGVTGLHPDAAATAVLAMAERVAVASGEGGREPATATVVTMVRRSLGTG